MQTDAQLAQCFDSLWPHLDEHARRLVAAGKAVELGCGGMSCVSRVSGISRATLTKGIVELEGPPPAPGRIRKKAADPAP